MHLLHNFQLFLLGCSCLAWSCLAELFSREIFPNLMRGSRVAPSTSVMSDTTVMPKHRQSPDIPKYLHSNGIQQASK
eukprot:15197325-Ditylum_brightwellii.AAC.1